MSGHRRQSVLSLAMGQAASDPVGSARQLKDKDLAAVWKSQVTSDGKLPPLVSRARDPDGRSVLHIVASEGMCSRPHLKPPLLRAISSNVYCVWVETLFPFARR